MRSGPPELQRNLRALAAEALQMRDVVGALQVEHRRKTGKGGGGSNERRSHGGFEADKLAVVSAIARNETVPGL